MKRSDNPGSDRSAKVTQSQSQEFTVPRGMRDIESEEMTRRVWIVEKIQTVLWKYGFRLVEPSPIENLETLEAKSGPEIRDQIFWFKDKADRELGLRFDLTVGLTRMIANRFDLPEPIKLASIGGMWRYDEPQYGRYRYFSQWDAEIYGVPDSPADAEIIAVGTDILESVGLKDYEVRLSNRKLIEGFLRSLGLLPGQELERVIRVIDKLDKVGSEEAERELLRAGLSKDRVKRIIGFTELGGEPDKVLGDLEKRLPRNEMVQQGFKELAGTIESLGALGKRDKCRVDLGIVRGIAYYDGTVFEAFDKGAGEIGSIFGGGRFDKLSRLYGKRDMAATGVAGGLERLMLSLEKKNLYPAELEKPVQIFVATVNPKVRDEAVKLAQELRKNSFRVDYDLKQRPLPKQLEYANSLDVRVALILGPRELEKRTVRIKDMKTGQETDVEASKIVDSIASMIR
ncbi:MAG TPA: histidine--tRNA ligase [Candidatus Binatus sp.]|nr:histidine--tRNA ligase [Candidatus Binatus sp.]